MEDKVQKVEDPKVHDLAFEGKGGPDASGRFRLPEH